MLKTDRQHGIELRRLTVDDAGPLARLLAGQRADYIKDFFPFRFDHATIAGLVGSADLDVYWGIYSDNQLAGFCMLRGRDAGHTRPSFGIFVAEAFSGLGLGRQALAQALHWCGDQGIAEVMLKVAGDNVAAQRIYEAAGFVRQGRCPDTGHAIYTKNMYTKNMPSKNTNARNMYNKKPEES